MNIPFTFQNYLFHHPFDPAAIKGIPQNIFWFLMVAFIYFTGHFFYRWYKSFIQSRVIQDIPTAKIRSAAQGYVELQGKQMYYQGKPTIAKLSKLPCTWYRYTIERWTKDRWVGVEGGASDLYFGIQDDTGFCVIDPKGAEITTEHCDVWRGFSSYPQGKPSNIFWRLLGTFGPYRYQEWRMEAGMPLYAAGHFRTENSDKGEVHILSKQSSDPRHPFVLSSRSEKKIVLFLKIESFIWFIASLTLFVGMCWFMIARFS